MNPTEKRLSVPALLAVLDERTEQILHHVEKMDGLLADTCLKLAKAEEIAKEAQARANKANGRIDTVIIGVIITFISALASIFVGVFRK